MSPVIDVTDAVFTTQVLNSDLTISVDFWVNWGTPCKQIFPILEELTDEYAPMLKFVRVEADTSFAIARTLTTRSGLGSRVPVEIDTNPAITRTQQIMTFPTSQIFISGKTAVQAQNSKNRTALTSLIEQHV